jgi:arylsulfatase A-like enzyme
VTAESEAAPHVDGGVGLEYHSANWGERPAPLRGWRTEEWKYVETNGGDDEQPSTGAAGAQGVRVRGVELYDLRTDSLEQHNLIDDPKAASDLERVKTQLHAWMAQTGDNWPSVPVPEREVPMKPGGPWEQYR